MVAMSAKLEPTPRPCATVRSYEDEIGSVEGPDAGRGGPEETAPCCCVCPVSDYLL